MAVINRYFLAANGFTGFRCYFKKLLDNKELNKLYIIKGGSGVGKSTLMRRVSAEISTTGYDVEEILCSSDPTSLDGVLIHGGCGLVLLIDGTSPHEYDMKYPIARDTIVDLSKHIDEGLITQKRKEILELIEKKQNHYRFAYKYLHIAGEIYKVISEITKKYLKKDDIKALVNELLKNTESIDGKEKNFLYSAFSRDGITRLSVPGGGGNAYYFNSSVRTEILFSALIPEIKKHFSDITVYTSPLSEEIPEGFLLNGEILFTTRKEASTYNSECYFEKETPTDKETLDGLTKLYEKLLDMAQDELSSAFLNHSTLEKIYGECMNFEKNDSVYESLIEKIKSEI